MYLQLIRRNWKGFAAIVFLFIFSFAGVCGTGEELGNAETPTPNWQATAIAAEAQLAEADSVPSAPTPTWRDRLDGITEGSYTITGEVAGFIPDAELIDLTSEADVRPPSSNPIYRCFPQSYENGDDFNRGCQALEEAGFPWDEPRAGFNYSYNASCTDVSRHCNIPIDTWKWLAVTGEEIHLPGVGTLRDPDGGAVLFVLINPWEIPGEFESAYVLHGYWGTGEVWDMSDLRTTWDEVSESYVNNTYGSYSLETLATLRDHFLYQLTNPENPQFRGQCSSGTQCETVTYVMSIRWYDGSIRMVQSGQFVR